MGQSYTVPGSPTAPPGARVSWGAIAAGVAFLVAMGCLLTVLGTALGVSLIDTRASEAMGRGLRTGAALWVALSLVVICFWGSVLTARLAGTAGLLHGIALWSATLTLLFGLGALGLVGSFGTSLSLIRTAAVATSGMAAGAPIRTQVARRYWAGRAESPLMRTVQAALERQAHDVLPDAPFDSDTLATAARHVVLGQLDRARQVLAVNTRLSAADMQRIVAAVALETAPQIQEAVETASTYVSGGLWVTFAGGLLSLLACMVGGRVGAGKTR